MYYSREYKSPLGRITIVCDDNKRHIVGLWLEGQKYYMDGLDASQVIPSKSDKSGEVVDTIWSGYILCEYSKTGG